MRKQKKPAKRPSKVKAVQDAQQPKVSSTLTKSKLLGLTLAPRRRAGDPLDGQYVCLQLVSQVESDQGGAYVAVPSNAAPVIQMIEVVADQPDSIIYGSAFKVHSPGLTGVPGTVSFENGENPGSYLGTTGAGVSLIANPAAATVTFDVVTKYSNLGALATFNLSITLGGQQTWLAINPQGILALISQAPANPTWMLAPSLALSRPVDWVNLQSDAQAFANAASSDPLLIQEIIEDAQAILPKFFPLAAFEDEQWGIVWAGINQLQQLDAERGAVRSSVACWGCRVAIGVTFAAVGGSMIVALGGFPAIATTGGFLPALGTALGVDLGILQTVLSAAGAATSFASWVDFICTHIPSAPCP